MKKKPEESSDTLNEIIMGQFDLLSHRSSVECLVK